MMAWQMRGAPVAGEVITTGTRAAEATGVDAERDTDPAVDAQQAGLAEAGDVPGRPMSDANPKAPKAPQTPSHAPEPAVPEPAVPEPAVPEPAVPEPAGAETAGAETAADPEILETPSAPPVAETSQNSLTAKAAPTA